MDTETTVLAGDSAPVAAANSTEPPHIAALREAIDNYKSRAQFTRKLKEQVAGRFKITPAHVSMWIRRMTGVPSYLAPDVEAISGVAVERLCPNVSWHVLRGVPAPKRRRPLPRAFG